MGALTVLKRLARHPFAIALGLVLALAVGTVLTYRLGPGGLQSRQYLVGVGSASVLLDSGNAQVSDLGDPKVDIGTDALLTRAGMLANLLVASPLRERIAASAQVPSTRLITKLASGDPGESARPVETIGVTIRESDPQASILTVRLGGQVPIISFDTQAPSRGAATRLANAAVAHLRRYLRPAASASPVPAARKLVIVRLGSAQASSEIRGPGRRGAIIAMVLAFATWCAGILTIDGSLSRRRAARAQPAPLPASTPLAPPDPAEPVPPVETIAEPVRPLETIAEPVRSVERIAEPVRSVERIAEPVRSVERIAEPGWSMELIREPVRPMEPVAEPVRPVETIGMTIRKSDPRVGILAAIVGTVLATWWRGSARSTSR